jgi:hypothetical protein
MADTTLEISRYGRTADGEIHASTDVYVPARAGDGVRVPGKAGVWRLVVTAGEVPAGAETIAEHDYAVAVADRQAAHDQWLADRQAAELATLEDAAKQLARLGLPADVIRVLVPGRQEEAQPGTTKA